MAARAQRQCADSPMRLARRLVRSLELQTTEIVGALCEQLRIPPEGDEMRAAMTQLAVAASACDTSRYERLKMCELIPTELSALGTLLDLTSLRVGSEADVCHLVRHIISSHELGVDEQHALWSTCRFSYLPADHLVSISEIPNVPTRWLALACAQRAAALGSAKSPPTDGMSAREAGRLKPRQCYK
jgi:hypothetical protein